MAYPTLEERIAELVAFQLPAFIREDHQNFITFMAAYYEWMETEYKGEINPGYGSAKILDFADIDKTVHEFINYFSKEFLVHIPQSILCDRTKLLKNIKQFYRSRGCEKSYELLFRILFKDEISFYYPTIDILRPDDGKWVLKKSIRCVIPTGVIPFNLNVEFVGKKVIGITSGASGVVDYIIKYDTGQNFVYELFFKKNTIFGNFIPWERLALETTTPEQLQIQPILIRVDITEPGTGYNINSVVTVSNPYNVHMGVTIKEVNTDGGITNIQILDPSFGYPVYPPTILETPDIIFEDHGSNTAAGTCVLGALFEYPGYYINTDGFVDSVEKLRDDWYYQEFSYVIKNHVNMVEWDDIIHKILHPAGTIVFGNLIIEPDVVFVGPTTETTPVITIYLAEPVPGQVPDVFLGIPNDSFQINEQTEDSQNQDFSKIGSTLKSINRDAFRNLPTQTIPSNLLQFPITDDMVWNLDCEDGFNLLSEQLSFILLENNETQNYANYSLSDLGDISLEDLLVGTKRTPIQPRVTITTSGFYITGRITFFGSGVSNITVELFDGITTITAITNDFGEYSFLNLPNGSYTVTPVSDDWDFLPVSIVVPISGSNVTDVDFAAEGEIHVVYGAVTLGGTPVSGITINITGPENHSTTTDVNGVYSFTGLQNGLYTVTPSYFSYNFSPSFDTAEFDFTLGPDSIEVDFDLLGYQITGTILSGGSPLNNITVNLTGTSSGSTTTDINGEFTFNNLLNGSYTVTPSDPSYTFVPLSSPVTINYANQIANFTTAQYYITGTILDGITPLNNIQVDLTGAGIQTVYTDPSGVYIFNNLSSGSYVVTPTDISYTFSPTSRNVTVVNTNMTGQNFNTSFIIVEELP